MPTYWTLKVGATEKSLFAWGISTDLSRQRTSKGRGTVTLRTIETFDPAAGPQFAGPAVVAGLISLTHAIIYRDRASADGSTNSFSAGSIYFQGYFDDPDRTTSEGRENIQYQLHNVWWLFERNPFKQHRNQFNGWDGSHNRVLAASVAAGGAGYVVGDTVTIAGGTGTAATFTVAAVSAGAVTLLVSANGGGKYTANPASPNAPTGGSGAGLSVSLVMTRSPLLVDEVLSEIFLGENLNSAGGYTTRFTTGGQIQEVIDWLNECYNPTKRGATVGRDDAQDVVQSGTIDPHTLMPVTRVNTVFCSDAIHACLRWEPDAVIQIDDSTLPPTINVRKLAKWNNATTPPTFIDYTNLPETTVTLTADQEKQIRLANQVARSLPGVIIYYQSWNVNDNVIVPQLVIDKYPGSIDDYTPEVSSHCIILAGSVALYERATVKGTPIAPAVSATASDRKDWWVAHDNTLNVQHDPRVIDASIAAEIATVKNSSTGAAIDTSIYLYELKDSLLPTWLTGLLVRATVAASVSFDRTHDTAQNIPDHKDTNRIHTKTLQLTNVAPGFYRQLASITTAEVPPQGVAESVYRSLNAEQYAGTITFAEQDLRTSPEIGQRYKLVGPNHTFINCLVQQVHDIPHAGLTTITFGPSSPIDLDTWIDLARASRERTTWNFPSGRGDGGTSQAQASSLSDSQPPSDDSSNGSGGKKHASVLFQQS
jgi:hypothetical protein